MIKQVTQQAVEQMITNGDLVIADVRDHDSYIQGHITGAIHLSMVALQQFCATTDKNKPIVVYCYHGITSQAVAQHLLDQGFTQVYSLAGGFSAWKEQFTSDKK